MPKGICTEHPAKAPDPFTEPHFKLHHEIYSYVKENEMSVLHSYKAGFRSFLAFVLTVVAVFLLCLILIDTDLNWGDRFVCNDVEGDEGAGNRLCAFRTLVTILSQILLLPLFWHDLGLYVAMMLPDSIPIANGRYVGEDAHITPAFYCDGFNNFRCLSFFKSYEIIWSKRRENESKSTMILQIIGFFVPNLLLLLSASLLSYFFIQTQENANAVFSAFVVIQLYPRLLDHLVNQVFDPRRAVGQSLDNYVKMSDKAVKPIYYPLKEYDRAKLDLGEGGLGI